MKHGWYSKKMARLIGEGKCGMKPRGAAIYETPSGERVVVTIVTDSEDEHGTGWDDIEYVSKVIKWVGLAPICL